MNLLRFAQLTRAWEHQRQQAQGVADDVVIAAFIELDLTQQGPKCLGIADRRPFLPGLIRAREAAVKLTPTKGLIST